MKVTSGLEGRADDFHADGWWFSFLLVDDCPFLMVSGCLLLMVASSGNCFYKWLIVVACG